MAFVNKLEIQGIRSVGPNDSEKVTIEFDRPFTLITGENGAGKTTIVEALKYATSGAEPPGAKVGGWIHHPKVNKVDQLKSGNKRGRAKQVGKVLAQIQCEFEVQCKKSSERKRLVAKRCLEGTIDPAKNKMTKSTIDGTICLKNDYSGIKEMESPMMKVEDMNRTINSYLHIPKPILEYVIFCHQEDTLWPFGEGKALKEKFDDIFQSSEFVCVLDQLRADRKETAAELKVDQSEKNRVVSMYKNAHEKLDQINQIDNDLAQCQKKLDQYSEDLKPLEEDWESVSRTYGQYSLMMNKYFELKNRIKDLNDDQTQLKNKNPDIKSQAERFCMEIDQIENEIEKCSTGSRVTEIQNEIQVATESQKSLSVKIDGIKIMISDSRNSLSGFEQAYNEMLEVCETAKRRTKCSEFDDFSKAEHRQGIQTKCHEKKQEFVDKEQAINAEEQKYIEDFQSEINTFSEDKARHEAEIKSLNERISERKEERALLIETRDNMSQATQKLNQLQKTETEITSKIEFLNAEGKLTTLEKVVNTIKGDKTCIIEDLELFESKENDARKKKEVINQLKDKEADLSISNDSHNENQNRINSQLNDISDFVEGTCPSLEEYNNYKRDYIKKEQRANEKSNDLNKKHLTKQAEMLSGSKELGRIRKELQRIRDAKSSLDDSLDDIEEERNNLNGLEERLCEQEEEMSAMKEGKKLFKKFLSDIKKKPCCPLCQDDLNSRKREKIEQYCREKMNFDNYESVKSDIDDLKKKIASSKESIKHKENENELESREDNHKNLLKGLKETQNKLKEELEVAQKEHKKVKDVKDKVIAAEPYIKLVIQNANKLKALKKRVNSLKIDLESVHHADDYDIVTEKLIQLKKQRKELDAKLESKENERNRIEAQNRSLINEREELRLKIKELSATVSQGDDGIVTRIESIANDVQTLEGKRDPIKNKINTAINGIDSKKSEIVKVREHYKQMVIKLRDKQVKSEKLVNFVTQKIVDFEQHHKGQSKEAYEEKIDQFQKEEIELGKKLQDHILKVDNLKEERSKFEIQASKLLDVKQYVEKEHNIRSKKREAKELKTKLQLEEDDRKDQLEILRKRKNSIDDQIRAIRESITKVEAQRDEKIKSKFTWEESLRKQGGTEGIDREVKEKVIDVVLKKACIRDLDKIHSCLENAIMNVHKEKMKRLNGIISHLWKSTYQGADIECISISCDAANTRTANTRRNYNYCVNMRRFDGTTLPMRGRASAGQRILASLIIRLALAQCFTTCGILALDEPTTNLDRRNIRQFARTLKELSYNNECQFIIITHDTEFVQDLCGAAGVQSFYRVTKNSKGYSQVEKRGSNTLLAASCVQHTESDEKD